MVKYGMEPWLSNEFPGLLLVSGGITYVGRGSMEAAIQLLENARYVILGFEGFKTDGLSITPVLEFIADLSDIQGSWDERVRRSAEIARHLAAEWRSMPTLEFVEFTLIEQDG